MKVELWQLKQRQSLPLEVKISMSKQRIRQWYEHWDGNVYVAFSGGKDSTVLLHLVRSLYPEVPAVFCNTGLEYPEIIKFVKTINDVTWLKPKKTFKKVIEDYGYPVISKENATKIDEILTTKSEYLKNKRLYGDKNGNGKLPKKWQFLLNAPFKISSRCCYVMKKGPFKSYERHTKNKPFVGTMASDSFMRQTVYLRQGCNAFLNKAPQSNPVAFWLKKDIWDYIKTQQLDYSTVYDMGYNNTGCMFCAFGVHLQKPINKFQLMKTTHLKLYKYCMEKLNLHEVLSYCGIKH